MAGVMSQRSAVKATDARRSLIDRLAASRYVSRSARLRDLLLYLSARVLDEEATEIHEQELGHKVFGRPRDYDTATDNIVRVHASMLRKRLDQYFASEGASEHLILEIPKGNYAPVFRERSETEPALAAQDRAEPQGDRRIVIFGLLACLFAASTTFLLWRDISLKTRASETRGRPTVALFWSQM